MTSGVVTVLPYDAAWAQAFEGERELLAAALAPWLVAAGIEHIGSTSIPGLAAKPIVDMMAGVRDIGDAVAGNRC